MKLLAIVLTLVSFSGTSHARVSLFKKEVEPLTEVAAPVVQDEPKKSSPAKTYRESSGLYRSWSYVSHGVTVILPAQAQGRIIDELKSGLILGAVIPQSVIAFGGHEAEVTAQIEMSGERFVALGKVSLEQNSKRILVEFDRVRRVNTNEVYSFKAHALDARGIAGLEGEYESGATKFFLAQLLSSFAGAMLDSSVSRSKTAFGQVIEEQSLEDKGKKAGATAAAESAGRYKEKTAAALEFSVLQGPVAVRMLIQEQPVLRSSTAEVRR